MWGVWKKKKNFTEIFFVLFLLLIQSHLLIPGRLVAFGPLLLSFQPELFSLTATENKLNSPLTDNFNKLYINRLAILINCLNVFFIFLMEDGFKCLNLNHELHLSFVIVSLRPLSNTKEQFDFHCSGKHCVVLSSRLCCVEWPGLMST